MHAVIAADAAKPAFATDDEKWAAVLRSDPAADGVFVLSVRTTGIYCRPTCGARTPLRRNVRFHANAAEAERAGFRPCKRCRPNAESPVAQRAGAVAAACRMIEAADAPPSLAAIATAVGMSPHHFHRVFKAATGLTPRGYAHALRAGRVAEALAAGSSVTAALHGAGFGSSGRFYATAGRDLGMAPATARRGGNGETIRWGTDRCSLGVVLVAASERGVCAILLGDDGDALRDDLARRFPGAELTAGDAAFADWVAAAVALVDDPRAGLALPLDIRGTAFQRRVWEALRALPVGASATYGAVAAGIGAPGSARAAAAACAANPLAVVVPCHRVVRGDGSLAGYRWGMERKRALRAREGAGAADGDRPS